ncbi:hypothetical protein L2E82_05806 [Cichorium intybus]|uniref:Uncharacterized protein n=1 Tax=Cichorium intybus TaxID=13427 RepID=A0ACB9H868_CICIN|nr:hypothetical protein L2E82_05806 [Cichorium intybus]
MPLKSYTLYKMLVFTNIILETSRTYIDTHIYMYEQSTAFETNLINLSVAHGFNINVIILFNVGEEDNSDAMNHLNTITSEDGKNHGPIDSFRSMNEQTPINLLWNEDSVY